jgi:D-glycero-alpha-D-manno-heptose-7-phosphate kinase
MIRISKTPLRCSFFGGGTDYPDYFNHHEGVVVGTTINLYIYITMLPMASFAETKYRVLYRKNEHVNHIRDIKHPVVRAVLTLEEYETPLNITISSDVPRGTGLGSSSAFTVGFINLISHCKRNVLSRYDLAQKAIYVEQNLLKENVGVQDQVHAAYGGLTKYTFTKNGFTINPIRIKSDCKEILDENLVLLFTGIQRHASKELEEQIEHTKKRQLDNKLERLANCAKHSVNILEQESPSHFIKDLSEMLEEAWYIKKSLSSSVSNEHLNKIHTKAKSLGALGGKLCGAGGGGFFLFLADPKVQLKLKEHFGEENIFSIKTENLGSQVITVE